MLKIQSGETIIFTGDSITDAERARPIGQGRGEQLGDGFVHMIHTLLSAEHPAEFFHIMNTGINGNTSRDLLGRFQEDVLDLQGDYVVICIGVNDVWKQFSCPTMTRAHVSITEYTNNLTAMIERCQETSVKKVIFLTPFFLETNPTDAKLAKMTQYGDVVKKLCEKYDLPCIDLQATFDKYLAFRHPCFIQADRVHPDWTGSYLIARDFIEQMGFNN